MLSRIEIRNVKLHAETSVDATPLTLFIGPNNSGKTSVFQAMLLWRQAAAKSAHQLCPGVSRYSSGDGQPYHFAPGQIVDVGDFNQFLRQGARELMIAFSGDFTFGESVEFGPGPTSGRFEIRVRENLLAYHSGRLCYEARPLGVAGEQIWEWYSGTQGGRISPPVTLGSTGASIQLVPAAKFRLLDGGGTAVPPNTRPEMTLGIQELANALAGAPWTLLGSLHAVFPLRGFEEAGYPLAEPTESLDRLGLADRTIALLSALAYNRQLEQRLSGWLEELMGVRIETKLLPQKRVTLLAKPAKGSKDVSLFSSEGTGASQLPFILVPIGLTPPGETIFLSEPEAHLHPRAQVSLTNLLIGLTKKEKRQFFVETHSEHVLHAILHAIATNTLGLEDVSIYYFENQNGKCVSKRLQLTETGSVDGGLPGFFDQSLGELTEYLEALKTK